MLTESSLLFALVWTVGGTVDVAGRVTFDKALRSVMQGDYGDLAPYVDERFKAKVGGSTLWMRLEHQ